MIINTKYDLNQEVWKIRRDMEIKFITCAACGGSGRITLLDAKDRICPECYGRKGVNKNIAMKWMVVGIHTIGQVRATTTNIESDGMLDNVGSYKEGKTEEKVEYMCYESGIGSGTIHNEDTLFKTKADALCECDKRNTEKGNERVEKDNE